MERQLFEKANFGGITKNGGKLVLKAVDYNFSLDFHKLNIDGTGKKTFTEDVKVPIQKEELYRGLIKGIVEPFLEAYNRVKFKSKEITSNLVFADIRYTFKSLYVAQIIGAYQFEDGKKNRKTLLRVYKLNDWNEVKEFNKEPGKFGGHIVAAFEFEIINNVRGSYVYDDIITLEELASFTTDAYFKRSSSYSLFLEDVAREKNDNKPSTPAISGANYNNGYSNDYKPKAIEVADSSDDSTGGFDEDEFPF